MPDALAQIPATQSVVPRENPHLTPPVLLADTPVLPKRFDGKNFGEIL